MIHSFLILLLLAFGRPQTPTEPETYRLRVENMTYGRVEISADNGRTYALIGRVLKPATTAMPDKTATTTGVILRSSGDGLAFSIAPNRALKLLPRTPTPAKLPGSLPSISIVTNLEPHSGLFGSLVPPSRTPVRLQAGAGAPVIIPDGYTPSEEDTFVFLVSLPARNDAASPDTSSALRQQIDTLAQNYLTASRNRAKAEKHPVVSGNVTLKAKLPVGEPDPITAVTYLVDGDVVAAQNVPPFSYVWDTRQAIEGEHLVEIRALNKNANLITRVRSLVFVNNQEKDK